MSDSTFGGVLPEAPDSPATVRGNGHENGRAGVPGIAPAARSAMGGRRVEPGDTNALNALGEKIFLDRYALKDMTKSRLSVGDLVVVCVNTDTGQREIGTVSDLAGDEVAVLLADGEIVRRAMEHVDLPLETHPDEMQARVARGVAAMEAPERRAEWEGNFRWLLEGWKFVPGGRILTAAGTEQDLTYYNCLPPDQEVLTEHGYRPIGSVRVGDRVVTHRNRLRRVLHTFEREAAETLFSIRTKKLGFDRLRVTGEHKVLAIRAEWVNTHRSRDGLRLQHEPEWLAARDLKPGDYLAAAYDAETAAAPILGTLEHINALEVADASTAAAPFEARDGKVFRPQVRQSVHGYLAAGGTQASVNDVVPVDPEVCYLFGRWLGDGCITHRTGTDIPSGIKIVFSLAEHAAAEQLAAVIERRLGVPAALKLSSTGRWYDLWANSLALGQLFKSLFGCYSYGKRIPSSLMRLPDECTEALLHGLFAADGYVSGNKMGIVLANRTLATQAHQLLLRLGYFFSIYENTHRLSRHPSFRVDATANECGPLMTAFFNHTPDPVGTDQRRYFEHDGLRWARIARVDTEEYVGPVLDLEVEEDHSFVSAGVVVSNCYVIPSPEDSRDGIIRTLSQMTEIMSRGGGVGINLSTLRPRYAYVKGVNGRSSGSVSWGSLYSFVTGLIEQGGSRRGALMLILNVWHPDMLEFIKAKRTMGRITNANISVGVTDDFMAAVEADASWDLVFPDTLHPAYGTEWTGDLAAWQAKGYPTITHKTVKARELWNVIIESAWASAEPGLWFNERSNKASNSWYYAPLVCTNPCGEQPLPGWSVCNLGAINVARFEQGGRVDWESLGRTVRYAVRFLDNVIDATPYFFEENERQQKAERRVGLGTMGLAELMIRCGVRYGSPAGNAFLDQLYKFIAVEAYLASADNAAEKGSFPRFEAEPYLQSGFMRGMPEHVRRAIAEKGSRNVTLLTQAPTGTTGTMVATSTGIEPFFSWSYYRKSRLGLHEEKVAVVQQWQAAHPGQDLPDFFVTAMDLAPEEHVSVQATIQRWVDSSISKTCNVPNAYTVEQTAALYETMYRLGCKGGTVYRDGSRDEQVLTLKDQEKEAKPAPATPVPEVKPRPRQMLGTTYRVATPLGKAYITVNKNADDEPFEVFVNLGKAGSDLAADAEAIGRLISLSLRMPSPLPPQERLAKVAEELNGIGGSRAVGFGAERVRSLPDGIAHAIQEELSGEASEPSVDQPSLMFPGADLCPVCGHASFVREEGCQKCYSCGHSEC
jgi:ribonucleoside-diphosphate reductase alpha chain